MATGDPPSVFRRPADDVAGEIDHRMELASQLLERTAYFESLEHSIAALRLAARSQDFERVGRIMLPIQEARRQVRQQAVDAGARALVQRVQDAGEPSAGCYLVAPPMIGADARRLRESLWGRRLAALVLAREPMTRSGKVPVVAVGRRVVRAQVEPPPGMSRDETAPTKDTMNTCPEPAWLLAALRSVGASAIAMIEPGDHPAWRVCDLLQCFDALPDEENLAQAIEDAAREAARAGKPPRRPYRPDRTDDPYCF